MLCGMAHMVNFRLPLPQILATRTTPGSLANAVPLGPMEVGHRHLPKALTKATPLLRCDGTLTTWPTRFMKRMKTLGSRCGIADGPQRLRDTFAVRNLLAGFQLEDVSRLPGHSSVKVTEAYYANWVPSRKLRLERLLAESFVNA